MSNTKVLGTICQGTMDFSFHLVTDNLILQGLRVCRVGIVIMLNGKLAQYSFLLVEPHYIASLGSNTTNTSIFFVFNINYLEKKKYSWFCILEDDQQSVNLVHQS